MLKNMFCTELSINTIHNFLKGPYKIILIHWQVRLEIAKCVYEVLCNLLTKLSLKNTMLCINKQCTGIPKINQIHSFVLRFWPKVL